MPFCFGRAALEGARPIKGGYGVDAMARWWRHLLIAVAGAGVVAFPLRVQLDLGQGGIWPIIDGIAFAKSGDGGGTAGVAKATAVAGLSEK